MKVIVSPELIVSVTVAGSESISKLENPPAGVAQVLSPLKNVPEPAEPVADKSEVTVSVAVTV